jgi:hypothetical protein
MFSFLKIKGVVIVYFLSLSTVLLGQTTGQVMFVGFNADGTDGFAFVTLVDLANGATMYINDNEWNGSPIGGGGAFNAGEGAITWSNSSGNTIAAGTVVIFQNTAVAGVTVNIGTASRSGTFDVANQNEVLYIFLGTNSSTPTVFLSAIANDTYANGTITNTGLSAGINAIDIAGDEDVMIYTGSINCTTTIADCATAIATTSNWTTQDTAADDSTNGLPDFPTDVPCNFYGVAFGVVSYYSRNATSGGAWDDNTSWTTNADGSGGPLATGVWPRRHDRVIIRSGHTISINAINDNKSCGVSPDDLPFANVGTFTSSNLDMFYHTGDITIAGTLSTTGIEMMVAGYTRVLAGGTFSLASNLVNVGFLEADATSTFSSLDDLILTGSSTTIINTNSTSTDDLIIDFTDATLCGTGAATLQNGAGSQITYTNGATVNQICNTFTVNCTGGGCTGFPVVGTNTTINGNTGPAGVGNLSNNRLWLMADRGAFSDNGVTAAVNLATVQRWNDQSGNNNNALQNTAGNRPIYRTGQDNNLPAIEFTGNLFIDGPALGIPGTGSFTYLLVFRDTQTGLGGINDGNGQFILDRTTATNELVSLKPVTGSFYAFQKRDNGGGGLGGTLSTTAINTNGKWIEMVRNRGVNYRIYYNGVQEGSIADADGNLTPPIPRIGRHSTTVNGGLRGFINEFFVYNSLLNNAQRIIINNYVSAKYQITLGVNDFYTMDTPGNGDFDFGVAGIGQATDGSNHKDAKGSGVVRMWNPSGLGNGEFLIWGHNNLNFSGGITDVDGVIIQERIRRIWRVSEVGDVGTVSISMDLSGVLGSAFGNNLRLLIDRDGDGFADNDVTPVAGSFSGTVVTFSGVNFQNGDRFTIGNTDLTNPLPIQLISFNATAQKAEVKVQWSTASELNNDFFTIQRSQDAENWEDVMVVKGAGNSNERIDYEASDGLPYSGVSYYRLMQTDFDKQFSYSGIKRVEVTQGFQLKVYPNPASDAFRISTGFEIHPSDVMLVNMLGQCIPIIIQQDGASMLVETGSINPGIYILQVNQGFWRQSIRVVIE